MTIALAPPPLQVPSDFVTDKEKNAFFSALLNTLYQLWTQVYSIQFKNKVLTTDATETALLQVDVPDGQTLMINAFIVARRTGGASGSEGDSAFYNLMGAYKNIAGVLTGIGNPNLIQGEDQSGWNVQFTSTGENAVVAVTGASGNNITWQGTASTYEVGS